MPKQCYIQSIPKSKKNAATYLLTKIVSDQRTITGKNVNKILKETNEKDIQISTHQS